MGREELVRALREARQAIEPGQEVSIGPFRPEDAPGIAQAYLETYGDAFPLEHVYDPEEIVRRNATDDQHTLVARTSRGEVVGLVGLFRYPPNPDVYEAGQLMVLKSYRRGNVATVLNREVFGNLPRRLEMAVVFGEAAANHPISQHLLCSQGVVFTGLELECMPSAAYLREGCPSRNISLFLMFKVFRNSTCAVHLPEAYREFCEALYRELGVSRDALAPASWAGDSVENREFFPESGLMRLTVHRAGRDFAGVVHAAEAGAGGGLVQVFLNLGDAAVAQAVELLRHRGYFLGGLLPHWFGPDGLLLQKVPREPDWDAIQVCGPEAEAMRALVRADFERARRPER